MRCKKHSIDLSSIVGICASCLREHLFRVILAQEQSLADNRCNSETKSAFPRSASPYIGSRKSDKSVDPVATAQRPNNKPRLHHSLSDQRFYTSPQIAINTGGCIGGTSSNRKKQSLIRFSWFSNLFRSNSRNGDANSVHRISVSTSGKPCGPGGNPKSVTSSPSWFTNVIPGARGRQKNHAFCVEESSTIDVDRKQRCVRDRGMSPVRSSDDGGEDEFVDGSSEYESAESCKQTPRKTPSRNPIQHGGGNRSVYDMIICLSPLVRATPNRLCKMKGKPPADGGFTDDSKAPVMPHLSYTKSFDANRSRKLADFGRSDPNR